MRWVIGSLCFVLISCGKPAAESPGAAAARAETDLEDNLSHDIDHKAPDTPPKRTQGVDWPRFLGPTGDSVSSETGILRPWPAAGLRVVWQRRVGTGYGAPSVSKGRLYLFDRHGDQARLACLNRETGREYWTFEYPTKYEDYYGYNNGPRCCPVMDGDRVYLHGAEGMLHCVRATDGKPLWQVDTKAEFGVVQNFFGVGSAPAVEGDLLIVQVGGSPAGAELGPGQKGNGSGVVAFDKRTGKVKYRATNELASYASPVLTTINGRRWCFVFARGGLIGLDPAAGKVRFRFPWRARAIESVNAANPVVVGDRVFISETYGPGSALLKIKESGYDVLWSDADKRFDKSMQCHWNTPIHHDGYLYGCSGRHLGNAELRCIELATGKVMWSQPELTRTSLMMVDGHFLCLSEVGQLILLKVNPRKYEEVSRMDLRRLGKNELARLGREYVPHDPYWAAPVLAHGLLYVRGEGRLLCLDLIPAKP
jgi:outer membrane protein assembly factor BamB